MALKPEFRTMNINNIRRSSYKGLGPVEWDQTKASDPGAGSRERRARKAAGRWH